jgi:hypothetical protein
MEIGRVLSVFAPWESNVARWENLAICRRWRIIPFSNSVEKKNMCAQMSAPFLFFPWPETVYIRVRALKLSSCDISITAGKPALKGVVPNRKVQHGPFCLIHRAYSIQCVLHELALTNVRNLQVQIHEVSPLRRGHAWT